MTTPLEAIRNAVTWLRANPDRHITGDLAQRIDHTPVAANAPDAHCFCVLGRISHELGLPNYPGKENLNRLDLDQDELWRLNDRNAKAHDLSNQSVLDFIESKLK